MDILTTISYGYVSLIDTFFKANELEATCVKSGGVPGLEKIIVHYEDNSDTAYSITFMGIRHLGFENMLCDYLIRCGVHESLISRGKALLKRDMKELDRQWEEHRKSIGLVR